MWFRKFKNGYFDVQDKKNVLVDQKNVMMRNFSSCWKTQPKLENNYEQWEKSKKWEDGCHINSNDKSKIELFTIIIFYFLLYDIFQF